MDATQRSSVPVSFRPSQEKDFPYFRRLFNSIVVALLAASFIPLLVIGGGMYYHTVSILEQKTLAALDAEISEHRETIDHFLTERTIDLKNLSGILEFEYLTTPGNLKKMFDTLQKQLPCFTDIGVIDDQGRHRAYVGPYDLLSRNYRESIGLLVIILTYVIRPRLALADASAESRKNKKSPALKDLLDSVKNRRTLPIFLIMFFNMIFMAAFFGFLPILLSNKGLDPLQAGFVLALNATVYLAVQPFAGRFSDSLGRKKVITLGLALCTLCISFIPFLPSPFYIGAACLMAVGIGCVAPLGEAFIGDVSEEHALALNLGIAGSYKELGEMTGPLTMGFVGQALGLQWAFLMVGVVGIGSLVCLTFLKEARGAVH